LPHAIIQKPGFAGLFSFPRCHDGQQKQIRNFDVNAMLVAKSGATRLTIQSNATNDK